MMIAILKPKNNISVSFLVCILYYTFYARRLYAVLVEGGFALENVHMGKGYNVITAKPVRRESRADHAGSCEAA